MQFDTLPKRVENPELEEVVVYLEPMKEFLAKYPKEILDETQAGLLLGMVLGIKEDLPKEFQNALRRTSTIHIVVVSGQNLTMLAGFCMLLAPYFGRKKTLLISAFIVIFYSVLSGLQVPVIRASIMVLLSVIAQFFDRDGDSFWILLLTCLLMLNFQPLWIVSISFQLSVLATFGVIVVAPELLKRLNMFPDLIKQDLAVTLSAQALTWPIIALNFHQFSIIGLLVNILVLWTVLIIMVSGTFALLVSVFDPILGQIVAVVPDIFLTYFIYVVELFNQRWASVYVPKISIFVYLGYYVLLLALFLALKRSNSDIDRFG